LYGYIFQAKAVVAESTCHSLRGPSPAKLIVMQDRNQKLTAAEFEEAAVSLGFSDAQAQRLFKKCARFLIALLRGLYRVA